MGSDGRRIRLDLYESCLMANNKKGEKIPKYAPIKFPWKRPVKGVFAFLDVAYAKGYFSWHDIVTYVLDTDFSKLRKGINEKELFIQKLLRE